ncbi:hypothetical protein HF673_14655 [Acidithiobacillus thiooxidans]|uniref:Uncharacterized protein n=2 Tax=Acidithiobacillus TaxID=119977 RepID=A0A1C2J232_ACITH|nr:MULTISPECIES: hypothetical protein [Acidithiobacillus]MBU2761076.1 hypothetical protein [Acidithiobacillus sulfurivorans]MBU2836969.1 hypothetical protein [Acidithiobacillus thiooxidans]OCX68181.1 hypothetical protein A6M23_18790 [Acidithiobacillus thiooxidans]OCX82308.1 hypothetical protein A6P08_12320 [Acidithiobacillus thiooxidans]
MSRDCKPLAGCKPADCKSVLPDCEAFEAVLRRVIRDPKNGPIAHTAAECLFAVRKLVNAITAKERP